MADDEAATLAATVVDNAESKRAERQRKLRELSLRRNEARKQNHDEVVEESKRSQTTLGQQRRQEKAQSKLKEEKERKELNEEGKDYDRKQYLNMSVGDTEWYAKKARRSGRPTEKRDKNELTCYSDTQHKQHEGITARLKVNLEEYRTMKLEAGEAFFGNGDGLDYGMASKPSAKNVENMVETLAANQVRKDKARARKRKTYNEDDEVDAINLKNERFNRNLDRFYSKYTEGIRENLERGTAL